mgnify:CR=1 FL=1
MIDKNTIAYKKRKYGNNFPEITTKWSEHLGFKLSEKDVCMMMALMKQTRIENIKNRLLEIKRIENFNTQNDLLVEIVELNKALEDSIKDKDNYVWIGNNYEEYLSL